MGRAPRRARSLAAALLLWAGCGEPAPETPDPAERPRPPRRSGAELAARACGSCHLVPEPDQLPRETWPFVLTWMSHYLGMREIEPPFRRLVAAAYVPPRPVLTPGQFERLSAHFREAAPSRRRFRGRREPSPPLAGFRPRPLAGLPPGEIATLVHVDPATRRIYVGLGGRRELRVLDPDGRESLRLATDSEPVFVEPRATGFRLTTLGSFDQHRIAGGRVVDVTLAPDGSVRERVLVAGFPRPVQGRSADLDGDGREDLLVVGFGNGFGPGLGRVSVFWNEGDDEGGDGLREQVLLDRAGGLGAEVLDLDADGRLDIVLPTAQASQALLLYHNRGARRFEARVLARHFPGFGYNALAAGDLDGDGHVDLVTANGNNMELPDPPLRPYHGIRVLRGDGALGFEEAAFHPLYGATQLRLVDYDRDGDLDIAATAFYPDFGAEDPETFTLLENRGGLRFAARGLGSEHWGRWLSLDAGDLDGDGAPELVLGSANLPGGGLLPGAGRRYNRYRRRLADAPTVLLLEPRAALPRDPPG